MVDAVLPVPGNSPTAPRSSAVRTPPCGGCRDASRRSACTGFPSLGEASGIGRP